MLTFVCGEDTVSSRKFFWELKNNYVHKEVEIKDITPQELPEILKWMADNISLFSAKKAFFVEHLEKAIIRKRGKKPKTTFTPTLEDIVITLSERKDVELVDWEEKSARDLKLKDIGRIKEFKPQENIFKFLECCKPKALKEFIHLLNSVAESQDGTFIFIMLCRHIRTLLLAKEGIFAKNVFSWQKQKLESQTKAWKKQSLIGFYQNLYKIELGSKSGTNPYGIIKSLEILACYYL